MATTPHIIDVYPAPSSSGIPIGDQITVSFDQEMDTTSINTGTFILAAPDKDVFLGEGFNFIDSPGLEDTDLFSSPYYGGFVKGTISFTRVDSSGAPVDDSVVDTAGTGNLWRTVAIFTPSQLLAPNVEYTVLVAGDEDPTNQFDSGVRTRTVFDPTEVSVSGTGSLTFSGGYTGSGTVAFILEITSGGQTGNAAYQWWLESDPLTVYAGITTTGERELQDGVSVSFDPDGTFVSGDRWRVVCIPFLSLPNTYRWTFRTGSGEILTPPSTSSTSGITDIGATTSASSYTFQVTDVSPSEGQYGVAISTDPYVGEQIVITFSDTYAVDSDTLVGAIEVRSESATGDTSLTATGELDFDSSLVGNQLFINLVPGQLYENNIVIVTLDSTIADSEGNELGTDYTTFFSTTYNPVYSSLRRVRLDLGSLISSVRDETIMLAILEASLYADAINFSTLVTNTKFFNHARREFVTCLAELMLVKGISMGTGAGDRMSKTLGDLSISRSGMDSAIRDTMKDLQACTNYWRVAVESNGEISPNTSLKPQISVKGALADDAITVARQWEPTTGLGGYVSAANTKVANYNSSSRRQYRTFRNKNSWRSDD